MAELPRDTICHCESKDGLSITVTMTELVHCEDCKYQDEPPKEDEGFIVCKKCSTWDTMFLTHPDDYCSWGERKSDGTD